MADLRDPFDDLRRPSVPLVPRAAFVASLFSRLREEFGMSSTVEAQGLPVENASPVPIAILFVGAFVLGGFIVYGILRNRTRTRAEKELTDRTTRQNYAKEDHEARSATSEN